MIGGSAVSQSSDRRVPADQAYTHVAEIDLVTRPMTAAEARRAVREHLVEWSVDPALVDVILLLLSEVVTNAARHAPPPLHLVVRYGRPGVRVEVHDSYPDLDAPRGPDHDEHGGRGLWLVKLLSTRWGYHPEGVGKVVWFDLEAAPVMQPAS